MRMLLREITQTHLTPVISLFAHLCHRFWTLQLSEIDWFKKKYDYRMYTWMSYSLIISIFSMQLFSQSIKIQVVDSQAVTCHCSSQTKGHLC